MNQKSLSSIFLFLICLSLLSEKSLAAGIERQPKSWDIEYYDRKTSDNSRPIGILCLTTRETTPFGHSAIAFFPFSDLHAQTSKTVNTFGFWPFRKKEKNSLSDKKVSLLENNPQDHPLRFSEAVDTKQNLRHCVPVSAREVEKMNSFFREKKSAFWHLAYNCNDLAESAFETATGISLKTRSLLTAGCSIPKNVIKSMRSLQDSMPQAALKKLKYIPSGKDEIARLIELEDSKTLNVSPFLSMTPRSKSIEEPAVPNKVRKHSSEETKIDEEINAMGHYNSLKALKNPSAPK